MSLTAQLAFALAITVAICAALLASAAPPPPRHRRRGLAAIPVTAQIAIVAIVASIAAATVNAPHTHQIGMP